MLYQDKSGNPGRRYVIIPLDETGAEKVFTSSYIHPCA
jgi:hypothetical protein